MDYDENDVNRFLIWKFAQKKSRNLYGVTAVTSNIMLLSEVDVVYIRVCKLYFFLGNTLEGRIYKLLAGIVRLYSTELRALNFIVTHSGAKLAVFAGRLDIVAKQFLFHIKHHLTKFALIFQCRLYLMSL